MAVDTRDKRASVLGVALAFRLILPDPGAIDQPDRQHLAYSYRGIQAGTPVPTAASELALVEATYQTTGLVECTYQTTETVEVEWG